MALAQSYLSGMPSPLSGVIDAYNSGIMARRYEDENKLLAAQHNNEIQGLAARQNLDFSKPDAVRQYAARYPELAKGVATYLAGVDERKKQALTFDTSTTIHLIENGQAATAAKILSDKSALYEKQGDIEEATHFRNYANMINQSERGALGFFKNVYAQLLGKDGAAALKDYMEANAPKVKEFSSGGETGAYIVDPVTGEMKYQKLVNNSISPNKQLDADTSMYVSDNSLTGTKYSADSNRQASMYSSDNSLKGTMYGADVGYQGKVLDNAHQDYRNAQDNATKQFEIKSGNQISWFKAQNDASQEQQKIEIQRNAGANGKNSPQQEAKRISELGGLISEAQQLLKKPDVTGSGVGSLMDKGAGFFGVSTQGSQITSRLKTIAGQLTSKMPRMEGPQSDSDRKMYEQMAGDVANDSLPVANRLAALDTMAKLNAKYAAMNGVATGNGQTTQTAAPSIHDFFTGD